MARLDGFSEPNASLPLRFATYSGRQTSGLTLIIAGGLLVATANGSRSWVALVGSVAHVLGWAILPAPAWRRFWATGPGLLSVWLLLVGPQLAWLVSVPLALWYLVRRRPGWAYPTLLIPIAVGVIAIAVAGPFAARVPLLLLTFASAVGAAWLARVLAARTGASISGNTASDR